MYTLHRKFTFIIQFKTLKWSGMLKGSQLFKSNHNLYYKSAFKTLALGAT